MAKAGTTRYYSDLHEKSVCKATGAVQQTNSGAGLFRKGDCIHKDASLLLECKTCMTEKESFSIKKEWIEKNKEEQFNVRMDNGCIVFNFGPGLDNYYVIDEKLMKFLVEKLIEENEIV